MPPVSPMRQTTILLATSNPDKQQALQTILEGLSLSPVTPGHIGLEFNPEERGETHLEVARDKAIQWSRASSNLAIASDGGLVVPALGSQWESLYTRRFVGEEPADDQTRVHRLLEMMRPYQGADRRASWVEALAIANRGRLLASWEVNGAAGVIAQEPPESLPDDSRFWVPPIRQTLQRPFNLPTGSAGRPLAQPSGPGPAVLSEPLCDPNVISYNGSGTAK